MSITELREALFTIDNQEQEITLDKLSDIIGLYSRIKGIEAKIEQLENEGTCKDFIKGWITEKRNTEQELKEYCLFD